MKRELKKLDLTKNSFEANGHKYMIESSVSTDRYKDFLKCQLELGYGITVESLFARLRELYDLLNVQKFADSAVLLHDLMTGVARIDDKREPPALVMCTLFINRENEDRRYITPDMIQEKIADWREEGIDVNSFFQLALSSIKGYSEILQILSRDTFNLNLNKNNPEEEPSKKDVS